MVAIRKINYLFFFVICLLSCNDLLSCDCSKINNLEESFKQASHVFIGTVELVNCDSEIRNNNLILGYSSIKINKIYKNAGRNVEGGILTLFNYKTSCDIPFVEGVKYLIFTDASDCYFLKTSKCDGTLKIDNLQVEDLKLLTRLSEQEGKEDPERIYPIKK
ncbi:hypothetical protein [Acidiluteibacter ferrifornacis]|uniref:Tissue inhibitor of metalloproteinase n=1 Tax=Acidiluteibacter ferrifornacis TaxID=2692424 RepID=A0A6N9NHK7_9FLAO|nr:hypothetical protein [Acidiluteibacter ferrifornacis]NBG64680.1 hypothetical protein [Acidiluteibacter ferrifornacis]